MSARKVSTHSQINATEIAILLYKVENVVEHECADAQSTVRIQASEGHDVKTSSFLRGVNSTANSTNNYIIVVGWKRNHRDA